MISYQPDGQDIILRGQEYHITSLCCIGYYVNCPFKHIIIFSKVSIAIEKSDQLIYNNTHLRFRKTVPLSLYRELILCYQIKHNLLGVEHIVRSKKFAYFRKVCHVLAGLLSCKSIYKTHRTNTVKVTNNNLTMK